MALLISLMLRMNELSRRIVRLGAKLPVDRSVHLQVIRRKLLALYVGL